MKRTDKIVRVQTIEEAVHEAVSAQNGDWFWTIATLLGELERVKKQLVECEHLIAMRKGDADERRRTEKEKQ